MPRKSKGIYADIDMQKEALLDRFENALVVKYGRAYGAKITFAKEYGLDRNQVYRQTKGYNTFTDDMAEVIEKFCNEQGC